MNEQTILETFAPNLNFSADLPVMQLDELKDTKSGTSNGIQSSLPSLAHVLGMNIDPTPELHSRNGSKSDSEAETIVLLHQNDRSPSENRKFVKSEYSSEDDNLANLPNIQTIDGSALKGDKLHEGHTIKHTTSPLGKRKRIKHKSVSREGSSRVSSVHTSPVRIRRPPLSKLAASDSEISRSPSPRHRSYFVSQGKAKLVDPAITIQANPVRSRSGYNEDDRDTKRFGSKQNVDVDQISNRHTVNMPSILSVDARLPKLQRSVSPSPSGYKRSLSSNQLPSKSCRSLSIKKKRVPAPLQPAEFLYSDDSLLSGNSRPQSSRARNLALSIRRDSSTLSAKLNPPHKKHVNSSGQTPLAVACARGRLELVQKRYEECPQDLNVPDNALNTPLHIASLEGWTHIVKFLLDTGDCELDCINTVKDTPLHDAIDNKNVEVVKLLLEAGANPCKPNQAGNDPLDLLNQLGIPKDRELAGMILEMKEAVISAKEKFTGDGQVKPPETQHIMQDISTTQAPSSKISPHQAIPTSNNDSSSLGSTNRKVGTARSLMKTTERVLYQTFDLDALRVAARDGDIATVSRVLDVRPGLTDAQTLYNAAKGGHDAVISLLFALGDFEPDPKPLSGLLAEYSTPILAAIGKDHHIEVIKLFLGNPRFNPARRVRGEKYYEVAKRRAGPKWREEVELLTRASEAYKKKQKPSPARTRSPAMIPEHQGSDLELLKILHREDQRISSRPSKNTIVPTAPKSKERSVGKTLHRKPDPVIHPQEKHNSHRIVHERSKAEDGLSTLSEGEASPLGLQKLNAQVRKPASDVSIVLENELATKPRRKLVSGKELKDERELERKRRASVASTASGISGILATQEKKDRPHPNVISDKLNGKSNAGEVQVSRESHHMREPRESATNKHVFKREKSGYINRDDAFKDRCSVIRSESPGKRRRKSESPSSSESIEFAVADYSAEGVVKKKRRIEDTPSSIKVESANSPEILATLESSNPRENNIKRSISNPSIKSSESRNTKSTKQLGLSKETNNIKKPSPNRTASFSTFEGFGKKLRPVDHNPKAKHSREISPSSSKLIIKNEDEASDQLLVGCSPGQADASTQKQVWEKKERQDIKHVNLARSARANAVVDEEAESKGRSHVELTVANNLVEEELKDRRRELERLQQELDRRKAVMILEQQQAERIRLEREQHDLRISKLPLLLRWFEQTSEAKTAEIAKLFSCIVGYRYDTINTEATGQDGGDDQWMLNTHAAILLGEKDLQLSQFTTWERVVLTNPQKRGVWNTCNGVFLLLDGSLPILRKQLPHDSRLMYEVIEENKEQFLDLDLFFVKVTEFMYVVPNFPHLKGVEMVVVYRELRIPLSANDSDTKLSEMRWQKDPLRSPGQKLVPLPRYFTNGVLICRAEDSTTSILKEPPPPDTYLRRLDLTRVYPGDSDYEKISKNRRSADYIASCKPLIISTNHASLS